MGTPLQRTGPTDRWTYDETMHGVVDPVKFRKHGGRRCDEGDMNRRGERNDRSKKMGWRELVSKPGEGDRDIGLWGVVWRDD